MLMQSITVSSEPVVRRIFVNAAPMPGR
jgi:hypothetical protein